MIMMNKLKFKYILFVDGIKKVRQGGINVTRLLLNMFVCTRFQNCLMWLLLFQAYFGHIKRVILAYCNVCFRSFQ